MGRIVGAEDPFFGLLRIWRIGQAVDELLEEVEAGRCGYDDLCLRIGHHSCETIRDILRRAYGTQPTLAFWRYRLASAGLIIAAVLLLLISLFAQVAIGTAHLFILAPLPQLGEVVGTMGVSRAVPALVRDIG